MEEIYLQQHKYLKGIAPKSTHGKMLVQLEENWMENQHTDSFRKVEVMPNFQFLTPL